MFTDDEMINHVHHQFSLTFLGGIPKLLNDDGAFLSFISVLMAVDALAGFRHPDKSNKSRFIEFVTEYFPPEFKPYVNKMWDFRNSMVHAFSPEPFTLTHHHSEKHMTKSGESIVLNAEDFYGALLSAVRRYFDDVRKKRGVKEMFLKRTKSPRGGTWIVAQLRNSE